MYQQGLAADKKIEGNEKEKSLEKQHGGFRFQNEFDSS